MPSPDGSGILFLGLRTRSGLQTQKKIQRTAGLELPIKRIGSEQNKQIAPKKNAPRMKHFPN